MPSTYVVLDEDCAPSDLTQLLGMLVSNPLQPLETCVPSLSIILGSLEATGAGPAKTKKPKALLRTHREKQVTVQCRTVRNTKAALTLAKTLKIVIMLKRDESFILKSRQTRTLHSPDHDQLLNNLLETHRDLVYKELGKRGLGNHLYMLVGLKTAYDPSISREAICDSSKGLQLSDSGVRQAAQGGSSTAGDNGLQVSLETDTTRDAFIDSTSQGERAFAAQYVRLGWKNQRLAIMEGKLEICREVKHSGIVAFDKSVLAFGKDDSDESISEDENDGTIISDHAKDDRDGQNVVFQDSGSNKEEVGNVSVNSKSDQKRKFSVSKDKQDGRNEKGEVEPEIGSIERSGRITSILI